MIDKAHIIFLSKILETDEYPIKILQKCTEEINQRKTKLLFTNLLQHFHSYFDKKSKSLQNNQQIDGFYHKSIINKDILEDFSQFVENVKSDIEYINYICAPLKFSVNKKMKRKSTDFFNLKIKKILLNFLKKHKKMIINGIELIFKENILSEDDNFLSFKQLINRIFIIYDDFKSFRDEIQSNVVNFYKNLIQNNVTEVNVLLDYLIMIYKNDKSEYFGISKSIIMKKLFKEQINFIENYFDTIIDNRDVDILFIYNTAGLNTDLINQMDLYFQKKRYNGLLNIFKMKKIYFEKNKDSNKVDGFIMSFIMRNSQSILSDFIQIDLYLREMDSEFKDLSLDEIGNGILFLSKYISKGRIEERYRVLLSKRVLCSQIINIDNELKLINILSKELFVYKIKEVLKAYAEMKNSLVLRMSCFPHYEYFEMKIEDDLKNELNKNIEYDNEKNIKISNMLSYCEIDFNGYTVFLSVFQYLILKNIESIKSNNKNCIENDAIKYLKPVIQKVLKNNSEYSTKRNIILSHILPLIKYKLINVETMSLNKKYSGDNNIIPEPILKQNNIVLSKENIRTRITSHIMLIMKKNKTMTVDKLLSELLSLEDLKIDRKKLKIMLNELKDKGYLKIIDNNVEYIP